MPSDPIELVCKEVVELVTDYLGGALAPAEQVRFDQHLATCPPCTAYLAQVRTTLDLAAELGSAAAPPTDDVARQLADLFRRWHGKRRA